jgi:ribosomal protein S18 acetylase RimI-like enzyme
MTIREAGNADLGSIDLLWRSSAEVGRTDSPPNRDDLAALINRRQLMVAESDQREVVGALASVRFDSSAGAQLNVHIFTGVAEVERELLGFVREQVGELGGFRGVHYYRGRGEPVAIEDLGFARGPAFSRMDRPELDGAGGVMPSGFRMSSLADSRHPDRVWRETYDEAFSTTWGFMPFSEEMWQNSLKAPGFDPQLWLIAEADNGEAAALVLSRIKTYQDTRHQPVGNVEVVCTRPEFRGRHVATELMAIALRRLRHHGARSASVRFEVGNPSEHIYGRLGFATAYTEDVWELRL